MREIFLQGVGVYRCHLRQLYVLSFWRFIADTIIKFGDAVIIRLTSSGQQSDGDEHDEAFHWLPSEVVVKSSLQRKLSCHLPSLHTPLLAKWRPPDEAAMLRLPDQLPAGIGKLIPSFFRTSRTYWNFWYCDSSIGPS
ncbi:hypothetical protein D3C73_1377290 [compost metagenome]